MLCFTLIMIVTHRLLQNNDMQEKRQNQYLQSRWLVLILATSFGIGSAYLETLKEQ